MFELPAPNRRVNLSLLNEALALLELPDFIGTAILERRQNADGVWESSERYLLVKSGDLTPAQKNAVTQIVAAHVAPPEPPPALTVEERLNALEDRVQVGGL